jgi:Fe-S cluster assembly protein SufD
LPSPVDSAVAAPNELYSVLGSFDGALLSREERAHALDRFFALRSGREKPGRFWRVDLDSIAPDPRAVEGASSSVKIQSSDSRVLVCDLATAADRHSELLARAFATTGVGATKFGALARAFAGLGAFIYLRADVDCDEPITIAYAPPAGAAIFPHTIVLAERGARATIVERIEGGDGAFFCGATEVVTEERAQLLYAVVQRAGAGARVISSRAMRPGRDAEVAWASAELGGDLAASDLSIAIEHPGARAEVTALFFPRAAEHVDVVSTVEHRAGEATSETLVKSAATESGQARFLGNIRIAPHAQGSDARLRDDALLLSRNAHVDSVPALEIGANDVKAYHGATVGAIDEEQVFYAESRGIDRGAAERMIALGFFEPAIERFPSESLRSEIRRKLAEKLS